MSTTMRGRVAAPCVATGFLMIRSICIRNFRCYEQLDLNVTARLNVIVGDNGMGKTTLLEAIFLTLATSTEVALRFRQVRGLEGLFQGSQHRIEDALWGDLFHNRNTNSPISVVLDGDGPEKRRLMISRDGGGGAFLPLGETSARQVATAPVMFTWTNAEGREFPVSASVGPTGISLQSTGEDMPDFFSFAAGLMTGSGENAGRFSEISQSGRKPEFMDIFRSEYPWILDLNIEVYAGAPVIFATLDSGRSLPLPMISGGINRVAAFMLAIASRPRSVVMIDEVESGIYFSHQAAIWRALIRFSSAYESQLFITTHSKECLEALAEAASKDVKDVDAISLWRIEREDDGRPVVRQFLGEDLVAGIEYGQEVR